MTGDRLDWQRYINERVFKYPKYTKPCVMNHWSCVLSKSKECTFFSDHCSGGQMVLINSMHIFIMANVTLQCHWLPTFCIFFVLFCLNYEFTENGVWIFSRCFYLCICTSQNSWHVGKCFVSNWLKTLQLSGQWMTWMEDGWIHKWMDKWRLLCLEKDTQELSILTKNIQG